VDLQPLTERILMLHFNDGHVQHHQRGEPRNAEKVFTDPLDVAAASRAETYTVTSPDDPAYREKQCRDGWAARARAPISPGLWTSGKTGGRSTRARTTQRSTGSTSNSRARCSRGATTRSTPAAGKNGTNWTLRFDIARARSEAVHVNTLAMSHGAGEVCVPLPLDGDRGSLDLKAEEGRAFHLVDTKTWARAYSGPVRFRMSKTNAETFHKTDSPPSATF